MVGQHLKPSSSTTSTNLIKRCVGCDGVMAYEKKAGYIFYCYGCKKGVLKKPLTQEEIKEINKKMCRAMKKAQDKIGFKTEILNVENLRGVN